jgi:hypothetical protein
MGFILQKDYNTVFEKFFGVKFSNEFYACANLHLSTFFEQTTQLKIDHKIYITWEYNQVLGYVKAETSSINCKLQIGHRKESMSILWKSLSGRIYELSDTDIDCSDIIIWLDGLNVEVYKKTLFPPNSLFRHLDIAISSFYATSGLIVSEAFISCADLQLTSYFERTVGYKVNNQVSVTLIDKESKQFVHEKGAISRLSIQIYNNHNWNPVVIHWHSKSGKIYDTSDTEIDCNDIQFGLEGIDAVVYQRQMYPKDALPFKLKNLGYELIIVRLNIDCIINATLQPDAIQRRNEIGKEIIGFVKSFNEKSESKARIDGVVHSVLPTFVQEDIIKLKFDIGTAGAIFFKKLLTFMSEKEVFTKVEIV